MNVFSNQIELIINNISKLEESINDHIAIINQLEREIAIISNKLDKLSSSSSRSNPLVTMLSSADLNVNVLPSSSQSTLTFFPRIDLPSVSSEPHVRQPSFSPPTNHNLPRSRPNLPPSRPHPPSYRPNHPPSRSYPPPSRPHLRTSRPYPPPSRPHSPLSRTNPPSSLSKPSLLILGDSNTKHIRLPINFHRIPTYTIEDIDPRVCIGYTKVWIHVGINSLKSIRCGGASDVRKHFDLFMSKIERIGMLSPNTTVIVSPILPTAIKILNDRACYFNTLLFSINRWWLELDFSIFADDNNMLRNFYRCYNNPMDKIHLGSKGLRELETMILKRTSLVDTRSYSSVVRS